MRLTTKCANCGYENDADNEYCIMCGVKLRRETENPAKEGWSESERRTRTCRNGHTSVVDPLLRYCPECGAPFDDEAGGGGHGDVRSKKSVEIPPNMHQATEADLQPHK